MSDSQFTQENTEKQADAVDVDDMTGYGGLPSELVQFPAHNSNRSRSPFPLIEPPDILPEKVDDPLKNFYAKARAELESEVCSLVFVHVSNIHWCLASLSLGR
jgi:hypothetical protein